MADHCFWPEEGAVAVPVQPADYVAFPVLGQARVLLPRSNSRHLGGSAGGGRVHGALECKRKAPRSLRLQLL